MNAWLVVEHLPLLHAAARPDIIHYDHFHVLLAGSAARPNGDCGETGLSPGRIFSAPRPYEVSAQGGSPCMTKESQKLRTIMRKTMPAILEWSCHTGSNGGCTNGSVTARCIWILKPIPSDGSLSWVAMAMAGFRLRSRRVPHCPGSCGRTVPIRFARDVLRDDI